MVGLEENRLNALCRAAFTDELLQRVKILFAVNIRLPKPEQVEVWPVDDQKLHLRTSSMVCTVSSGSPLLSMV